MSEETRPYPELLTDEEQRQIVEMAEQLWADLQSNNLGGYSGINRPFYIANELRRAVEQFGHRDTGLHWTRDQLNAASNKGDPE
jgi:hypothetical protein